jgi:membrane-bound lytic murein transglycosylase D
VNRLITATKRWTLISLGVLLILGTRADVGLTASTCPPPHFDTISDGFRYGFPPQIEKAGLVFASKPVPIHRRDVRNRILKEVNYLLQDRRSRVLLWMSRADSLKPVIAPILRKYGLPQDFIYLAAIESSYNSRALSSAGAFGYWQFIKSTAQCGPAGCDQYDWKMHITNWKDDRADLVHSTHSAAKYLCWMNRVKKVSINGNAERQGFDDWFLTTAAYNAGPTRVIQRLNSFGAHSYWDVPLPIETEKYVPRWIAISLISNHRDFYGVQIPLRPGVSFDVVEKVRLEKDLSFTAMAKLLETTPRIVWSLNTRIFPEKGVFPARSGRSVITHTIHVPKGTRNKFMSQLVAHGYVKKVASGKP